jgi:hypothetical protein
MFTTALVTRRICVPLFRSADAPALRQALLFVTDLPEAELAKGGCS